MLPQPNVRGVFRFALSEIVQVDHKPTDLEAGIEPAEARLDKLIARGVDLGGQIELIEYALVVCSRRQMAPNWPVRNPGRDGGAWHRAVY